MLRDEQEVFILSGLKHFFLDKQYLLPSFYKVLECKNYMLIVF